MNSELTTLQRAVMVPAFHRHLELCGHHAQQGRKWRIIDAQEDARKSQVAKLHGEAQSIRGAATLTDHRQVGFVERVVPYQFVLRGMVSLPAGTGTRFRG